jgi:peptidyl-prolyl cis-trans isomerase D
MASQTPKAPAGKPVKADSSAPKRGIKNPWIYAGTIVVLVIIVVAFVFVPSVGGTASSLGNSALEFGSYAGKSIAYGQGTFFSRQVTDLNDRLRQQGLSEQNFQFFAYQVYRGAFERTVVHYGIIDDLVKAGAHVTDTRLDALVLAYPAYQEGGKFSVQLYKTSSLAEKLDVRQSLREDELVKQYTDAVFTLEPSSKELAFVKSMAKDTRTIEYAAFPLAAYPDSEVLAWARSSPDLFRRLKLSRVTIDSTEAEALKVQKRVKDKSLAFEDAVKNYSKDSYVEKGGDQGWKLFHEVSSDLEKKEDAEKLAALPKGEISAVFKTVAGGWAFFRADEPAAAPDFADPALLANARDYMNRYERGRIEDWSVAKAKAFAASAPAESSFQAACRKAGLSAKTAGPFPLNYGNLDVNVQEYGQRVPIFPPVGGSSTEATELAGAATNEKFLSAAFTLAPGALADPIVLGDNVIVLRVKEAGTALDDSTGSIDLFYPYYFQQKLSSELSERFLKSPALKDKFSEVFFKYFQPSEPAAKQ